MRVASCLLVLTLGCPAAVAPCPEGSTADADGLCWRDSLIDERVPAESGPQGCETPAPPPILQGCENVYDGDLHFASDAELAGFCDDWDCATGGVMVGGVEDAVGQDLNTAVTSLAPLSCLRSARFFMVTNTANLPAIEMPSLVQTLGGMTLGQNPGVQRISMPNLGWIAGDLSVQNNAELHTLDLPSLVRVGEFFIVRDNASLPSSQAEDLRDSLCPDGLGAASTVAGNGDG